METVIQGSTLQTLRAGLRGTAHAPGEEGYEEASRAWNLAARQTPALVVVARGAADVMAAVRFAREGGLGIGPRRGLRRGPTATSPPPRRSAERRTTSWWATTRSDAVLHRTLWNKRPQREIL